MGLITCRKKVYGSDSTSVGAVSVEGLCTTQGVTPRDGRLTHAEDVAHKLQVKAKSLSPVQLSATLRRGIAVNCSSEALLPVRRGPFE